MKKTLTILFLSAIPAAFARAQITELKNPLAFTDIQSLIVAIMNAFIILAVPIIVFFVIFAGFSYVTAQGNPEKIRTATTSLTYAIIGGVIIVGAVAIMAIVGETVTQFTG